MLIHLESSQALAPAASRVSVGAGLLHRPLTSVVIPVEDIARRAVGRVLRQIEDSQDTDPGEIVATWLREGESTPVHR